MRKAIYSRKCTALFLSVLAGVLLFSGALFAREEIKDSEIMQAIEKQFLFDESVSAHLVDVQTADGIVTLKGSIDNILAKERAVEIAESIKGVKAVIDRINVKPVKRSDEKIKADAARAILMDPAADSYEIKVSVENGVVTLEGDVESWAEKQLAAEVAKGVKGVRDIKNQIAISYVSVRPDEEIRPEIKRRLESDPYINEGLISVSVNNGKVVLSGSVGSASEKGRAYVVSWVNGVKSVKNNLEVKWWLRDKMRREDKFVTKPDSKIEKAVKEALLYDPRTYSFNINVSAANGAVTLSGVVDNLTAKMSAEKDAMNTLGVWKVSNYLKVRPDFPASDAEIEEKVQEALLRDTTLARYDFGVEVINQKAYLYGTVNNYYEREWAEDVAAGIFGVVEVDNNLVVNNSWSWARDDFIKESIDNEFFWNFFVDGADIDVSVEEGVATLTGKVDSWQELNTAIANAFEGGARKVKSRLTVYEGREYYPTYYYGTFEHWAY